MNSDVLQTQWTRSHNGWLAGVCEGVAKNLDLNSGLVRLFWLISILCFGLGLGLYLICAFIMPVEGQDAKGSSLLGVCGRLSQRLEIDVVPLRILTVMAFFTSGGIVFIGYLFLHFLLPRSSNESI